jgi:hypothetical protein
MGSGLAAALDARQWNAICVSPICREPPDFAAKPTSAAQLVPTRLHNSLCDGAIGKAFSNVAPDVEGGENERFSLKHQLPA